MKKITKLTLENHRGYYNRTTAFRLSRGENLLIYGENGSGKSSLFKALYSFFQSSTNPHHKFIKNHHNSSSGHVEVTFQKYFNDELLTDDIEQYVFGSDSSTNQVEFIKTASNIKGFLDYTDLLKVYNNDSDNLFDVIVLHLLKDYIAIKYGATDSFSSIWLQLKEDLLRNSYTRSTSLHTVSKNKLKNFEAQLRASLDDIFTTLNLFLSNYFDGIGLHISYKLLPINVKYGKKKEDWRINTVLKLVVRKNGNIVENYKDELNEARLSAFSICLYLASLKNNPSVVDYKLLYLDDVFIGLDAGNRLPILKVIHDEFSDYQVFISTHDRYWYESSKLLFERKRAKWNYLELYENLIEEKGIQVTAPIINKGTSHIERAYEYLFSVYKPDFPSSANYFRKALEQVLIDKVPTWVFYDNEMSFIPEYSLSRRLKLAFQFLEHNSFSLHEIIDIEVYLKCLLHPLSHHDIYSPIYKVELIKIGNAIRNLADLLDKLNIENTFNCLLERGCIVKLKLSLVGDDFVCYHLVLKDNIVYRSCLGEEANSFVLPFSSYCTQISTRYKGDEKKFSPSKKDENRYHYSSLEDCIDKLSTFLCNSMDGDLNSLILPINLFELLYIMEDQEWKSFEGYTKEKILLLKQKKEAYEAVVL